MEFNVAQLLKGPVGDTRSYHLAESLGEIEEIDWAGPGEGEVRLVRTTRGVLVRTQLQSTVHAVCSRCVEPYQHPLAIEFEEEFLPTVEVETGVPLAIGEEDAAAFTIDEQHILDLHEAVRQFALLAMPMQPVCRPDCQGLCPECGANRNLGPCQCPQQPVDRRWGSLSSLIVQSSDEKGAT